MERALATPRVREDDRKAGRRPIRLMIVDDSIVARAVLSRMIEADGGFEIAAVAGTAEDAIDALATVQVDIILLDLEMPGAGGLKLIPEILEAANGARVMIVSSLADEGAEQTVAALALGAADTLPKPGTGRFNGRFSEVLLAKLRALGHADDAAAAAPADQAAGLCAACAPRRATRSASSRSAPRPAASMRFRRCSRRLPPQARRADPGHPASAGPVHGRLRAPAWASPRGARRWSRRTACALAARPDRHRARRRASDRRAAAPPATWSG